MALRVPPPEIPIVSFLTPNKSDQGLLEFWNTEIASYVPLDIGAPHPNQRLYPNFRLGKQTPVQGDEKWTLRIWVTDETNPDWFDYALKYAGEDNAFPTFIRTYREPRATYAPRTKGEPLKTLYKLVLTENGNGYANGAYPSITFSDSVVEPTDVAIAHGVVASDGSISEAVLDFGGEGYEADLEFDVAPPISGTPAKGIAYVQPQTVFLTREEASLYPEDSPFYAQYLQVARVYETIPGPTFNETKLDVDGDILNVATTRKFCSEITTEETIVSGTWCKTTSKPTDIDVICEEVVECRPIPGNLMESTSIEVDGKILTKTQQYIDKTTGISLEEIDTGIWRKSYIQDVEGTDLVCWQIIEEREVPGNPMVTTRIDEDGKVVTVTSTLFDTTAITSSETLVGTTWAKTYKKEVSDLVAWKVVETRAIPGNPMESDRLDDDGVKVQVVRTMESAATIAAITPRESIVTGVWTKITSQAISDLVAWKIVETRAAPGNPMVSIKMDKDGVQLGTVRTLKDTTTIAPSETVNGSGIWITIEKEAVSDLVAWEVVTGRSVKPTGLANPVVSYAVDGDHEVVTKTTLEKETGSITPSATESGGTITTVEAQAITDLVSQQVTTEFDFLDKALYSIEIPNLIPQWARPQIPTLVESHILAGTAAQPTLGVNEFEASEHQLTELLYERRVTKIPSISFPVTATNQELTEEYGGGVLNVTVTLDDSALTIDEGLLVVSSETLTLAVYTGGPPDGLFMKTTKELDDSEWPVLEGTEVDPRTGIVIGIEKQVVAAGATGGVSGSTYTDVKSIDKWRSITIASALDPSTLPEPLTWETTAGFVFPDTLNSIAWLWAAASGTLAYDFSSALLLDITEGYSGPCRALVTEEFTNGPPVDVVSITQFFPQAYLIGYAWAIAYDLVNECGSCRDDTGAQAKTFPIPSTLHDELSIGGAVTIDNGTITDTIPATDPISLPTPGTLITKSVEVEPWRFGVFYRKITEIYVPG